MIKAKMFIVFAVMLGALLVSATPAFAEFESKNGGSNQGKGEIYEATLEGGGARVTCGALEEGASKASWTVENKEGKSTKKGPGLLVKIANWGKCQAKAKGLKKAEAKVSECEMEVKQPEEQIKITGKIVKTCTIKASTCEVKIEPKNNTELKTFETALSGETDTAIDPNVTGIVAEASKECAPLGIENSKAATFKGSGVFVQVREANMSEFAAGAEKLELRANGNKTIVTITRRGGAAGTKVQIGEREGFVQRIYNGNSFNLIPNGAKLTECETTWEFEPTKTCNFEIERIGEGSVQFTIFTKPMVNGPWASAGVIIRAP